MQIDELNKILEGFLPTYEVEGIIIHDKHGYNILDKNNVKMLNKSYLSLKQMLLDIANNL